ncbi:phage holin [Mammaliicoccus sciuri]|nr:phage holin [Mammaliicoccus sciuri]TFU88317.1 phage holin [Mammaliicoccus sciuri]
MKNIDAGTLTRIIVLVLALINQALALTGFNPIPVDEDALYQFISMAFMGVASIWAWWKNNPVTKEAKWADEKKKKYKAEKKMAKATGYAPVTEEPIDGLTNK